MTMKTFYIGVAVASPDYELTEAFVKDFADLFPADVHETVAAVKAKASGVATRYLKITVEEVTE